MIGIFKEKEFSMNHSWHNAFSSVLSDRQILESEPMSRHTTFGIGGPADCFLLPRSKKELCDICRISSEEGYPLFIIGGGANLLVRDRGIRGVVLSTELMNQLVCDGQSIITDSGNPTGKVARFALACGLAGMEFASGIPGSVGGAAYMNAGAYGGEMSKIVASATTCDPKGQIRIYNQDEIGYAYRHSLFMQTHEIIISLALHLYPDSQEEIRKRMEDLQNRRRSKQPLEYRSAGSTFKRPPGHFVGAMIEELGLKGFSVGDAQVSEKHAGFLINRGHATCRDMISLMQEVQQRVRDKYGVSIEPEVQIVGEEEEQ